MNAKLRSMMRSSFLWVSVVAAILLGVGFAWLQTGEAEATPPYPSTFEVDFSGTGLVEEVTPLTEGCQVRVALYAWLSLSQGFELAEIPSQDERYYVTGSPDHCTALTVAMAGASEHIAFDIGRSDGDWYFINRPAAGVGCGGLEINWTPAPYMADS